MDDVPLCWGTKSDQEVTLAISIKRTAFDSILRQAVPSSFQKAIDTDHETWKQRLADAPVRLQWDPDHDPVGIKQERRAIQLGLSGEVLRSYAQEWIVAIEDISDFVAEQRLHASGNFSQLLIPEEGPYPVQDPASQKALGLTEEEEKS